MPSVKFNISDKKTKALKKLGMEGISPWHNKGFIPQTDSQRDIKRGKPKAFSPESGIREPTLSTRIEQSA